MTAGGDYMAEIEANLVETRQVGDANQSHVTAYASASGHHGQPWSLSNNSVASLQNPHKMAYDSTENGHGSTFAYCSDQQRDTTVSSEAPKGLGTPLYTPTASSAPPGVPSQQEYSGYTSYQYSTSSHGYTSSEYANNYYGYQQPANDSSHQQVGMAQNTGAPYQSLSSFQNASPYAGSTSYSGTYYNPGDYQTTSGYQTTTTYPSSSYSNQSTLWNGGTGGNAPPYGYSSYPFSIPTSSETNVGHHSSTTVENPLQYQQQYGHWGGYYGQTTSSNALCAPGTENMPVIRHNTVENQAPKTSGGYPYASNQPPPPGTTSWRQDLTPSPLPASQGNKDYAGYNQGWRAGEHGYQTQHPKQPTLYSQKHLDSNHFSHSRSEDQQEALNSQSSNLQFPLTNQVSQNFQTPTQTAPMTNICQSSRIQIPTNPRIASNMVIGMQKADTESTAAGAMQKPAYISVATPRPNNKEPSQDSSDNKGTLPPSLRAYVERTFARCRDDSQRAANQDIMKEMITKASADGTLLTRNWDIEPLFSLPDTSLRKSDNNLPNSTPFSQLAKHRKSPSRRAKSRWEPLPEERLLERTQPANHIPLVKNVKWDQPKDNNKVANPPISNGKDKGWGNTVFVPAQQQVFSSSNMLRPPKRQRFGDPNRDESGDASSDSDKEHGLTKYYSSAIALADSPEERKKREYRVKRFEKGQGQQCGLNFRQKSAGSGTLYARRTDLLQAKTFEDNGNRAVEDIAWDSLTVRGTCQEIEKRYLRLTSAPDPATVRPEDVVQKALLMVQSSQKNYLYKCDQLKSIRQDLTVQRIQNELTVQVYETHARLALEAGDLAEYNQCQSQLKSLYSEGIKGLHSEFSAYNLLHVILHSSNNRELLSLMSRLSSNAKEDEAVKHALAVRSAVVSGNYVLFFRLYKGAPNLNTCLMDLYVEKMRFEAVKCMCKSYRPAVPIAYIAEVLGFFKRPLPEDGNGSHGLEDCDDWLRAHGAILTEDNNGELQLDTKASSSTLYMPEPEDAVSHGDATLAVDDFLARTS